MGAHDLGRVIDVNNALDGDGPFLPKGREPSRRRTGQTLLQRPLRPEYPAEDDHGQGGLRPPGDYNDLREVERRIAEGDKRAALFSRQAYHISKEIGARAAVLGGLAEAVILDGRPGTAARSLHPL